MSNRAPRDTNQLADIPLDQLLQGLATDAPRPANTVELWIEAAGVYPGTTKVRSVKLYEEYREFMTQNPQLGKPLAIRVFGKYMVTKFKRGRSETGQFYYISREREVLIPTSENMGGGGTGGRGDPVP